LKLGYRVLFEAAVAIVPERLLGILGLSVRPGSVTAGRMAVAGLRWALGYSPTWQLALVRTGSPIPENRFKQPIPVPAGQTLSK
jgi:hypothetical protein